MNKLSDDILNVIYNFLNFDDICWLLFINKKQKTI